MSASHHPAFLAPFVSSASAVSPISPSALRPHTSFCRAPVRAPLRARFASPRMCEPAKTQTSSPPPPPSVSSADATRDALKANAPRVQYRRGVDMRGEQEAGFAYTSGNTGGVDVWLVSGVLCFLVPLVVFAVGIGSGYIDVTPR